MAKIISFEQAGNEVELSCKVKHLENFWRLVARNEAHVRDFCGTVRFRATAAEPDWEFEDAYEAIEFYLRPLRNPRLFIPPSGLPGLTAYRADTAHQALMYFLNPPAPLFGHPLLLDSPEYLQIKREAHSELAAIQGDSMESDAAPDSEVDPVPPPNLPIPLTPIAAPTSEAVSPHGLGTPAPPHGDGEGVTPAPDSRGRTRSPRARGTRLTPEFLERWLTNYHHHHSSAGWLSQEEIAKKLKCSQSTISRTMPLTFNGGGTRIYKALFRRN